MTSLSELRFFTTPAHECSYLDGREATTLFVDPLARVDTALYSRLSAAGFRRSGSHVYRPCCEGCNACIPVRIPVNRFSASRRHRRVLGKCRDLMVIPRSPVFSPEYFELYRKYIDARHADGDMFPADEDQFRSFLVDGRPEAVFFEFRLQDRLLAVAVADRLDNGYSAIYTFFDPLESARSPGVFAILALIEETRRASMDYLYLGYWIQQCAKMSYKMEYQPLELYVNNRWTGAGMT